MRLSLVIPTRNAAAQLERLLEAALKQTAAPDEILIVDSQSEDNTLEIAKRFERVRVLSIAQSEFDHGGTRNMALSEVSGEFVLFMTQDALPFSDTSFEALLASFKEARIAAVSGRQIAFPDAQPAEKLVRAHSYPAADRRWDYADVPRLGLRAFMISNVFCAYRRGALLAAGGFEHPLLTNEDMLAASSLLAQGHALAYCAKAAVYHSHRFTLREQLARNYRIGRTLERYSARFAHAGETGEGLALARDVLAGLIREGHYAQCLRFGADCAARMVGNRLGRLRERLDKEAHHA